ncbi:MAG TPA: hypothetical protein DEA44_00825, partial [Firmicutes bacterium]|nr:hypothetical protein [Bacillota bacterium]
YQPGSRFKICRTESQTIPDILMPYLINIGKQYNIFFIVERIFIIISKISIGKTLRDMNPRFTKAL